MLDGEAFTAETISMTVCHTHVKMVPLVLMELIALPATVLILGMAPHVKSTLMSVKITHVIIMEHVAICRGPLSAFVKKIIVEQHVN